MLRPLLEDRVRLPEGQKLLIHLLSGHVIDVRPPVGFFAQFFLLAEIQANQLVPFILLTNVPEAPVLLFQDLLYVWSLPVQNKRVQRHPHHDRPLRYSFTANVGQSPDLELGGALLLAGLLDQLFVIGQIPVLTLQLLLKILQPLLLVALLFGVLVKPLTHLRLVELRMRAHPLGEIAQFGTRPVFI